jgi:tripartite-type tricarboxylate transporter receptor subunit TctC
MCRVSLPVFGRVLKPSFYLFLVSFRFNQTKETFMLFNRTFKAVAMCAVTLTACSAWSQAFPSKPVTVVVPYTAGGAADNVARYMTKEMTLTLKQPMPVENAPGVGGALGTMKALNAPADGYTVLLSGVTELILTPLVNPNAKYKSEDFKTVTMVGQADIMLVTRKDLNISTVAEFIELGRKSVDKPLSYCSIGIGSQFHLISEKFAAAAGMKSLHVPYSAFPQCMTDIVGQVVDFAFLPIAGPFPGAVEKGLMKIIATTGSKQHSKFPNAPLIKDVKGFQDFVFAAWAGMHVSSKVSDDTVNALNKSAVAALETPYVKGQIAGTGSERFDLMTAKQAHEHYLREVALYRAIAKSIDLKLQQ